MQAVTTGFQNLETRISEVGRTTVRVGKPDQYSKACRISLTIPLSIIPIIPGDELESLDRLRTRASEARDIITYYYEFAKGDFTR